MKTKMWRRFFQKDLPVPDNVFIPYFMYTLYEFYMLIVIKTWNIHFKFKRKVFFLNKYLSTTSRINDINSQLICNKTFDINYIFIHLEILNVVLIFVFNSSFQYDRPLANTHNKFFLFIQAKCRFKVFIYTASLDVTIRIRKDDCYNPQFWSPTNRLKL